MLCVLFPLHPAWLRGGADAFSAWLGETLGPLDSRGWWAAGQGISGTGLGSWVDVPVTHEVFPTFTSLVFPAALNAFHFISLSLCHCFTDLFLPKTQSTQKCSKASALYHFKAQARSSEPLLSLPPQMEEIQKTLGSEPTQPQARSSGLLPCMTECFVSGDCDASRFNDEALPHFIFPFL